MSNTKLSMIIFVDSLIQGVALTQGKQRCKYVNCDKYSETTHGQLRLMQINLPKHELP